MCPEEAMPEPLCRAWAPLKEGHVAQGALAVLPVEGSEHGRTRPWSWVPRRGMLALPIRAGLLNNTIYTRPRAKHELQGWGS